MKRILIAGIGNIFLGDDGFGVAVAQRLAIQSRAQPPWPAGVAVHDFGIRCLDLAYALLDGWDAAILVDAAARGGPPGTLYHIELDSAGPLAAPSPDGHSINVDQVKELARQFAAASAQPLPALLLVGCEPMSLEPVFEEPALEASEASGELLSPPVAGAVEPAAALILNLVSQLSSSQSKEAVLS